MAKVRRVLQLCNYMYFSNYLQHNFIRLSKKVIRKQVELVFVLYIYTVLVSVLIIIFIHNNYEFLFQDISYLALIYTCVIQQSYYSNYYYYSQRIMAFSSYIQLIWQQLYSISADRSTELFNERVVDQNSQHNAVAAINSTGHYLAESTSRCQPKNLKKYTVQLIKVSYNIQHTGIILSKPHNQSRARGAGHEITE